jgi:hypothetical protein
VAFTAPTGTMGRGERSSWIVGRPSRLSFNKPPARTRTPLERPRNGGRLMLWGTSDTQPLVRSDTWSVPKCDAGRRRHMQEII